jgi:hypothetical protein
VEHQAKESKRLTFSQKWGDDPFTQSGHTQVPNALIVYAHRLGLRSEECWLITCILRFKYDDANPTPSQELLAELFGQSVDTVQRTVKKIVDKKLLKVERVRDDDTHRFTHTVYDFTPLRFALNECHYQDHPEERPQMPTLPERATPQKCGLENSDTHTAEMRPGFSREPHRRNAAWATPQICGVHKENKKNINEQEKRSLNVSAVESGALREKRSTANEGGRGINAVRDKAVDEIVALTGDESSRRRFWQLWEVAERNQSLDAWSAALRAVQKRQSGSSKQPLDRPGAYFCTVLIQELEKREIFVPTNAEKLAEGDVGEVIRQGLFGKDGSGPARLAQEQEDVSPTIREPKTKMQPAPVSVSKTPEQWDIELTLLEHEDGATLEEFEVFVAARRESYQIELAGMGATARERLLAAFDRPEKRRDLFRQWSAGNSIPRREP